MQIDACFLAKPYATDEENQRILAGLRDVLARPVRRLALGGRAVHPTVPAT